MAEVKVLVLPRRQAIRHLADVPDATTELAQSNGQQATPATVGEMQSNTRKKTPDV
jgi:hypothetical protein